MAIYQYSRGADGKTVERISNDGGKTFTETGTGKVTSGNTGTSKYGYSSGNNQYTGNTGKQYNVSGANGAITVNRPDGTSKTVQRGDADYQATLDAMQKDGVNYTPNTTYTNQNGTHTTKSYTAGNKDLQYALEQAAKGSSTGVSVDDYVNSLYNRVGSQRADGSTVSLQNVTDELTRLGLTDYLPGNAIYTAGGTLLPGNEFVSYHDNNGQTSNSEDSRWASYGGQDYLVGGDSNNFVNYVNALTGNYNNLDYIFGGQNMANNPYAQENPEFLNQFNQQLAALYAQAGGNGAGSAVGNVNTNINNNYNNNSLGGYVGSLGALSGATGNNYASDLWSQIEAMLRGGNDAYNQFLDSQQATANRNAEELARQAWVNSQLAGDGLKEGLSAAGLGASGALQSAQLGVQNNFNNSLANINNNLNSMNSSINEQRLAALTDLNKNLTDYAYQIQSDEYNRALQQAQLYQQQLEYQNALQQQQWENAFRQQQAEIANQQFADELAYNKAKQQGDYYTNMYAAGSIGGQQYQQYLKQLGLL